MKLNRRAFLITGFASLALATTTRTADADRNRRIDPWISNSIKNQLPQFGVNPSTLQWDILRQRDISNNSPCYDLFLVKGRVVDEYKNITPRQAVNIASDHFFATGLLMELNQNGGYNVAAIYQVNGHRIHNIARPTSRQPVGDYNEEKSPTVCSRLKING